MENNNFLVEHRNLGEPSYLKINIEALFQLNIIK